jgi:hypothetical protein
MAQTTILEKFVQSGLLHSVLAFGSHFSRIAAVLAIDRKGHVAPERSAGK